MAASADLYWLPLGAGGHFVRFNGRAYETISAALARRPACDLYHSALEIRLGPTTYAIEVAPVWNERSKFRGVVAEGAVGSRLLGRLRLFRYEVRCWPGGRIPDIAEAVGGAQRLTADPGCVERLLELIPRVPIGVWGRDELGAGDMWNSNSVVAWLIASCGIDMDGIHPPVGGRAPGWQAGLVAAASTERGRSMARRAPLAA